jgi:ABC-2 type transport system permease protein
VFEGLRGIVAGQGVAIAPLAWGITLALAYLVAACLIFGAVYRRALRVGLIARYSAESLS